ncbi:MAG TPA: hypothetical protein VIV60_24270, partial [Polyangiaceae bacterium]
ERTSGALPVGSSASASSERTNAGDALTHLPSDCPVVGRVSIRQILNARQLATHRAEIESALSGKTASHGSILSAMAAKAGINPAQDFDVAAFCLRNLDAESPEPHSGSSSNQNHGAKKAPFVMSISGRMGSRSLIDVMAESAPKGTFVDRSVAGVRALEAGGKLFAQASDKVLLIASNVDALAAAVPSTDSYKKYQLPLDGAIALSATDAALRTLTIGRQDPITHPLAVEAAKASHLDLEIRLDSSTATVHLVMPSNEEATTSATRIERMLSPFKSTAQASPLKDHMPPEILETLRESRILAQDNSVTGVFPMSDSALGELLHGFALLSVLSQGKGTPSPN